MKPEIWRRIFDTIDDLAFLHDAEYRLLAANEAYCREAGLTEAEALGKPYWQVLPRGTGPLPGCLHATTGNAHSTGSKEEVNVGEKIFLSIGYTVRDDLDRQIYSVHILRDITEQGKVVAALAESEERWRRAAETARDAIVTIDGESGAVTSWNAAAEAMFGYSKDETIGRVLHDFLPPPRFRQAASDGMTHFATTGKGAAIDKTLELTALHKNGVEFPIEISLAATRIGEKWHATGIWLTFSFSIPMESCFYSPK